MLPTAIRVAALAAAIFLGLLSMGLAHDGSHREWPESLIHPHDDWHPERHAQHHNHPPQDAALHERFYSTWMRPDNPSVTCCNLQDCYPTEFKLVGQTWFAKRREDGQWVPIPEERLEHNRTDRTPAESPDGRSHVCMEPPFYGVYNVWCAILGFGG